MKTDYANQNNRTVSEIAFALNRKMDAEDAALAALAAGGNKRAIEQLAYLAKVNSTPRSTAEQRAQWAAESSVASRSAASVTASVKVSRLAEAEANRVKNIEVKAAKAVAYQELLIKLAAAKAAKLSA